MVGTEWRAGQHRDRVRHCRGLCLRTLLTAGFTNAHRFTRANLQRPAAADRGVPVVCDLQAAIDFAFLFDTERSAYGPGLTATIPQPDRLFVDGCGRATGVDADASGLAGGAG